MSFNVIKFRDYKIYYKMDDNVRMFDITNFLKQYNKTAIKKRHLSKWLSSIPSYKVLPLEERDDTNSIKMKIPGKFVCVGGVIVHVNYEIFCHILSWINEEMCEEFRSMFTITTPTISHDQEYEKLLAEYNELKESTHHTAEYEQQLLDENEKLRDENKKLRDAYEKICMMYKSEKNLTATLRNQIIELKKEKECLEVNNKYLYENLNKIDKITTDLLNKQHKDDQN